MKNRAPLLLALSLAACTTEGPLATPVSTPPVAQPQPMVETRTVALDPAPLAEPRPGAAGAAPIIEEAEVISTAPPPPQTARTAEEFDTTTPDERAAAAAPPADPAPAASGDGRLGTTVASLGAAGEPGFWIKTPLVSQPTAGRLFYAASGRNVQVQLLPSGGATGSGSQVSLAAMRLLDAPLDGLPELVVYTN